MKKKLVFLFVVIFALSSCTRRLVDFTIISTKNVDLSRGADFDRGKSRVEGLDEIHIILFIPTGVPNAEEAVDKAIESVPGCVALLDGVLYSKWWWIPYIYGKSSFLVEGTPLIDPTLVDNSTEIPNFAKVELDKNGKVKSVEEISSEEFLAMKEKISKNSMKTKFTHSTNIQ